LSNPLATPSSVRAATPPPVMDRRGPLSSTHSPTMPRATPAGEQASSGPNTPPPPDEEAAAPREDAPGLIDSRARPVPRPGQIPWMAISTFLIVFAAAVGMWVKREEITSWAEKNAPNQNRLLALWHGIQAEGTHQLGPILKTLHIDADPGFVFNLLAGLVVLLLLRNVYASIVRARNRRIYLRAQMRQ
jgi:hypothetical protein